MWKFFPIFKLINNHDSRIWCISNFPKIVIGFSIKFFLDYKKSWWNVSVSYQIQSNVLRVKLIKGLLILHTLLSDFIFRSMAPPMCTSPIIINISSTFKKLQYGMVIMFIYQGLVYSPDKSPGKCFATIWTLIAFSCCKSKVAVVNPETPA